MDPRRKYTTIGNQFGESRFLSSFSQQSKLDQSEEPTPKKPKLDIAKTGNSVKSSNCASISTFNKKDAIDDLIWGDYELDFAAIAQVELDETIAQSQVMQMTQSNVNSVAEQINEKVVSVEMKNHPQSNAKKFVTSDIKNSQRVPLRRIGSSQWPSSSTPTCSHPNNGMGMWKGPANSDFLHSDLEKLRLENKRIKEELNKKSGEARILREKIHSSEKEKEKIRRDFSDKMNTLKVEGERNSYNLEKEIKSLRSQLDVKNMEIKTAERRLQISSSLSRKQPDSPNRLGASSSRSLQKDSSPERELSRCLMKAKAQGLPLKFLRDSVTPELLESSQPEAPLSESARTGNPRLFSGVLGIGSGGTRSRCPPVRRDPHSSHTSLSPCAALLLSPSLVDITSDCAQQAVSQVVDVCHNILRELLNQLESASCSNNRFLERERELLMSGFRQLPLDREYDLVSHRELYEDERGITARRALGLMSLLVQASHIAAKRILSSNPNDSTEILDTLRNIVRQVEKQRRTLMFQGVLAGSVELVKNLLDSETAIPKETQTLMVDLLRWVVLARPGSRVMRGILQTLLAASRFPHIINSLCHNSAKKTYKENIHHSIIQFTPDSCILQVLCTLLKTAETPRKHELTDLLTLWVLSLFCGGQPRPQWLTAVPTAKTCQCHSLVCELCFSMLSDACFAYPTTSGVYQQLVEKVLSRGVLLMNTFMNEDEHLPAIADPHSLGCYEHFLHFMFEARITLATNTRDVLEFLCKQEEVLKQPSSPTKDGENTQLLASLNLLEIGDNGKNCPDVLEVLESL